MNHAHRCRITPVAILVSALLAAGCDGDSDRDAAGVPAGEGQLVVNVTDAPVAIECFSEASVTIDRIELVRAGTAGTGGGGGVVTVTTGTARTFNLLDLTGGAVETAAAGRVPAGDYDQVRVYLSRAVLTWADGFQLALPITGTATTATGTAIPGATDAFVSAIPARPIRIRPGVTTNLILDVDLGSSLLTDNSLLSGVSPTADCDELKTPGVFTFRPRIRAIDEREAAIVTGMVRDGSGAPVVGATVGGELAFGGGTFGSITGSGETGGPAGSYALYLEPGSYVLTFEVPGRVTQTATVNLSAGAVERIDATFP